MERSGPKIGQGSRSEFSFKLTSWIGMPINKAISKPKEQVQATYWLKTCEMQSDNIAR